MFRLGLKRALEREPNLEITWDVGSLTALLVAMTEQPVDVILVDIYMGEGRTAIGAIRELTQKWPELKVAAMSGSLDSKLPKAIQDAGADVFLGKASSASEMVVAIQRLVAGARDGSDLSSRPRRITRGKSRVDSLSQRELQVLEHLGMGRTNREIAERLGISVGTVNKHVSRVLTVLHVRNRTQAAAIARSDSA